MSFEPDEADPTDPTATTSEMVLEARRFGSGELSLSLGPAASAAAQEVRQGALALMASHPDSVRGLGELVQQFPWVLRMPEMHAHLDALQHRGEDQAIARIVDEPRRGRRHANNLHIVAIVDELRRIHGCTITRACELAIEGKDPMNAIRGINARTMQSRYSELKERHDRYVGAFYIPGGELKPEAWSRRRR